MVDQFGALRMPQPTAIAGELVGDPGLDALLGYLKVAINTRLTVSWAAVAPGQVPVKTTFAHDPSDISFNERDLPALYITRQSGKHQQLSSDIVVSDDVLTVLWVPPPVPQATSKVRSRMFAAVARAIAIAVRHQRSASWVHDRDLADADALLTSKATSTSAVDYVGDDLDGVVGSRELLSPRHITISATAVVGAYSLSDITVEGLDANGDILVETVTPLSADGGWMLTTSEAFKRVSRVAFPAQALTTGAFTVGHDADELSVSEGSPLLRHTGMQWLKHGTWRETTMTVEMADGSTRRVYPCLEVKLDCRERWFEDIEADYDLLDGVEADFVRDDGTLIEQALYD